MSIKQSEKVRPDSRVSDLARSPWLDTLTASELAVLLRVVAATRTQGKSVKLTNAELHSSRRTAQRALASLQSFGLITVQLDEHDNSRTVDVLCL